MLLLELVLRTGCGPSPGWGGVAATNWASSCDGLRGGGASPTLFEELYLPIAAIRAGEIPPLLPPEAVIRRVGGMLVCLSGVLRALDV